MDAKIKNIIVRKHKGINSKMANMILRIFGRFQNIFFSNPDSKMSFSLSKYSLIFGTLSTAE